MQILLLLFILIPIIEIAVFIQVGDLLGLWPTLATIIITAVIGVNLLRSQGTRTLMEIQLSLTQGQLPALEMVAGGVLIFAGGLLLTPGFVTDAIGFTLMVPGVRKQLAGRLMQRWQVKIQTQFNQQQNYYQSPPEQSRTFEGEFEEKNDKDKLEK